MGLVPQRPSEAILLDQLVHIYKQTIQQPAMQKQYSVLGYKATLLSKDQLFQATELYRLSTKGSSHKALGPISQSLVYWGQSSTKLVRFQTSEQLVSNI